MFLHVGGLNQYPPVLASNSSSVILGNPWYLSVWRHVWCQLGLFSPDRGGFQGLSQLWASHYPRGCNSHSLAQPNVPFVSSCLGHAGTSAAASASAGRCGVYPTSEAARRPLPGPAASRELSFSSKLEPHPPQFCLICHDKINPVM